LPKIKHTKREAGKRFLDSFGFVAKIRDVGDKKNVSKSSTSTDAVAQILQRLFLTSQKKRPEAEVKPKSEAWL
jgi:hypothetical protein